MTKTEARNLLKIHNDWRRGNGTMSQPPELIGKAIDELCEPPSISQALRDAALNWPVFLSDEECGVLDAFAGFDRAHFVNAMRHPRCSATLIDKSRIFMLFVAEALE